MPAVDAAVSHVEIWSRNLRRFSSGRKTVREGKSQSKPMYQTLGMKSRTLLAESGHPSLWSREQMSSNMMLYWDWPSATWDWWRMMTRSSTHFAMNAISSKCFRMTIVVSIAYPRLPPADLSPNGCAMSMKYSMMPVSLLWMEMTRNFQWSKMVGMRWYAASMSNWAACVSGAAVATLKCDELCVNTLTTNSLGWQEMSLELSTKDQGKAVHDWSITCEVTTLHVKAESLILADSPWCCCHACDGYMP